jgi:hypothetical protein
MAQWKILGHKASTRSTVSGSGETGDGYQGLSLQSIATGADNRA